jgi:hypothetical protein
MDYAEEMNWKNNQAVAVDLVTIVSQAYGINHKAASDLIESVGATIKKKRITRRLRDELLED